MIHLNTVLDMKRMMQILAPKHPKFRFQTLTEIDIQIGPARKFARSLWVSFVIYDVTRRHGRIIKICCQQARPERLLWNVSSGSGCHGEVSPVRIAPAIKAVMSA